MTWLLGNARYVRSLTSEFQNVTRTSDALLEVERGGKRLLLHLEFQVANDPTMAERLLEYNMMARRMHSLPVLSIVIYLKDDGIAPEPPLIWTIPDSQGDEELVLHFGYVVFKLSEQDPKELLALDLPGLLPLLPLTRDAARPEMVERMISGVLGHTELDPLEQKDLLTWGSTLAGLIMTGEHNRSWLQRRFAVLDEILSQSWVYQEIKQKGADEVREEARREAEKVREVAKQKQIQEFRQTLLALVESNKADLLEETRAFAEHIEDTTVLQRLIINMMTTHTLEQARAVLAEERAEYERLH